MVHSRVARSLAAPPLPTRRGARVPHSVFRSDRSGALVVEGVPVDRALAAAGAGTPAYLYGRGAVVARFREFREAVSPARALVAVALKANALPALLAPLRDLGAGAEAVSAAELLLANGLGFPAERLVLSGVGKTEFDLDTALDLEVRFVSVESAAELDLLARRASRRGRRARVVLRLNPDIAAGTHPKIATGVAGAKFGMAEPQLLEAAEQARGSPGVEVVGVHAHLGSQIRSAAAFRRGALRLAGLLQRLREAGHPAEVADLGGGVGLSERDGSPEPPFAEYAEAVLEPLAGLRPEAEVVFEPGRCLFGASGALLVRVLHTKTAAGKEFLVVDGGMSDFLRPALYGARHEVAPARRRDAPERLFEVVGGVCETGDSFGAARSLPAPEPGDLLAVLDAGAYGYSMASNYNLRPRPAEVVVADGESFLARPGETPAGLAATALETALAPPPAGAGSRRPVPAAAGINRVLPG